MRVLYVSPYPPARDGIGTYTHVLAGAVRARGHEIAVVAAHPHGDAPAEVIGAFGVLGGSRGLRDAVAGFAPDVVHVQFAVPAFGARTIAVARWLEQARAAAPGVPVVATLHEAGRDLALLRRPGRILYERITACCDHVVVHTQGALGTLTGQVGVAGTRAEVIPHFSAEPPPATSTAGEQRARFGLGDGRILLAFGFIHVSKGLDDLVRAMAVLRRADPAVLRDVHLVVAGTVRRRQGPFRIFELRDRLHLARVRYLARRNGLRPVFTGFVPEGDIAAWFAAAEAVVLPYRSAEQSGVANLARAFGVPVIASTAGGLAELFADSRWTVPPRSPDRLATAIADLLSQDYPVSSQDSREPQSPVGVHGRAADLDSVATETITMYGAVRARTQGKDPDAA
ncbi:glycosyltransferase [Actinomadura scrupuli]|uniref:glycosyltransferase n=1 Tax=Actinomadura scrupuli TaxID=559629 RepID=UPI003D962D20